MLAMANIRASVLKYHGLIGFSLQAKPQDQRLDDIQRK